VQASAGYIVQQKLKTLFLIIILNLYISRGKSVIKLLSMLKEGQLYIKNKKIGIVPIGSNPLYILPNPLANPLVYPLEYPLESVHKRPSITFI
jgi:hypothetical protein